MGTDNVEGLRDERGRSLLNVAVLVDAPLHVIHELLEAAPTLLNEVNLLDGRWPVTVAGKEVRRLALMPRRALPDATTPSTAHAGKRSTAPNSTEGGSSVEDDSTFMGST